MDLIWATYHGAKGARNVLLAYLGDAAGKVHGLETKTLTGADIQRIRHALPHLAQLSLSDRIAWLQSECPHAYRAGYRTIFKNRLRIHHRYSIGKL